VGFVIVGERLLEPFDRQFAVPNLEDDLAAVVVFVLVVEVEARVGGRVRVPPIRR
jgi:hypothetical protein